MEFLVRSVSHLLIFSDISDHHTDYLFFSTVICKIPGHFMQIIFYCILFFSHKANVCVCRIRDKRLSISGIISGYEIMQFQVYGLIMPIFRKIFPVCGFINNNDCTPSLLRRIDMELLYVFFVPENLILRYIKLSYITYSFSI